MEMLVNKYGKEEKRIVAKVMSIDPCSDDFMMGADKIFYVPELHENEQCSYTIDGRCFIYDVMAD